MRTIQQKLVRFAAVALVGWGGFFAISLGTGPVLAQDREFVGITAATTLPNIGLIGMHQLCRDEFPRAFFCNTADIIRNGSREGVSNPSAPAWIHPSIVFGNDLDFILDATGLAASQPGQLSCGAWQSAFFNSGLLILPLGGFIGSTCEDSVAVACCALPQENENSDDDDDDDDD